MSYKIVFIDEEKEQQEWFEEYFDSHKKDETSIISIFPGTSMEDMISTLDEQHPDAIIADFLLNEIKEDIKHNVPYNGVDLVQTYQYRRPEFPCFILTSKDEDALNESSDVNMVYVKGFLKNEKGNTTVSFYDRVIRQIAAYRERLDRAQSEVDELIEKRRSGQMTIQDNNKLVELDDFIERSLDRESSIPADMKSTENIDKLSSMVAKLDELLAKLD